MISPQLERLLQIMPSDKPHRVGISDRQSRIAGFECHCAGKGLAGPVKRTEQRALLPESYSFSDGS